MRVYVVMTGVYENTWIGGVYSTPEAAMAAHPAREARPSGHASIERPGGWLKAEGAETWSNGLDWDDHATISEYEVE